MKKQIKLITTLFLCLVMMFPLMGCGSSTPTFEEACDDLKQEILSSGEWLCEFEHIEVYGRPVYAISLYVPTMMDVASESVAVKLYFGEFKNDFKSYIEENFVNFTDESIFVGVYYKNSLHTSEYIYGYYKK